MFKLLENALLAGLGATALTAKKAEELVNKAVSDKEISAEEGDQLLKTIIDEGKKAEEQLKTKVDEIIASKGESLMPYYKRLQNLEEKVAALEAKIAALEAK